MKKKYDRTEQCPKCGRYPLKTNLGFTWMDDDGNNLHEKDCPYYYDHKIKS